MNDGGKSSVILVEGLGGLIIEFIYFFSFLLYSNLDHNSMLFCSYSSFFLCSNSGLEVHIPVYVEIVSKQAGIYK